PEAPHRGRGSPHAAVVLADRIHELGVHAGQRLVPGRRSAMNAAADTVPSADDLVSRLTRLERKLAELADRDEIRDLIIQYATHLDARELRRYAALFTDDGTWVGGLGTATGHD